MRYPVMTVLSAALLSLSVATLPALAVEPMKEQAPKGDAMKKDTMMKGDAMKKDSMHKDGMIKSDGMKKDSMEKH